MHTTRMALVIGSALFAATSVASAQQRDDIPASAMPPAGMCRVWVDGTPVWRQRPPTDCDTARRTAPANARIIYGSQTNGGQAIDPRRGQTVGNNDPRYDPRRHDQPNGVERARYEERQRLERQRLQRERQEHLRLERERQRLEEARRREEWKRAHRDDHDNRHSRNDDHHGWNDGDRHSDRGHQNSVRDPRRVASH